MNPWLIVGLLVAWIASLAGVGFWQREDGRTAERVAWEKRESSELREANAEIDRLHTEARAKERAHAGQMAAVGINYQEGLLHAEDVRRRDLAAVRAGALRLRVPAACPGAGAGGASAPGAAAGGGDGVAPGELPGPLAAALLDLAHDADGVAEQLAACQAVIRADRQ